MHTKTGPLIRLRWKLTLSYALVTIAVLGVLYLALFILAFITRQKFVSGSPSLSGSTEQLPAVIRSIVRMFLSPLPIILVIIIGILIIGTIFGMLASRGLVKRLGMMTRHAANWGRGDFSGRILDHSTDEIGGLSRDLDRLAGNLQELILERQHIAALDERDRLRRDLHDSVKQQIFAANMNLSTSIRLWDSNPGEARTLLETAVQQVHQAQNELNSLIQPELEDKPEIQDIKTSISNLGTDWEKQTGIHLSCEIIGEGTISPAIFGVLYRVTQEALANIARHSHANNAFLKLDFTSQIITLAISDDGRGFNRAKILPGMGLRSMQERVETVGGQFELTSGETGTFIQVEIPFLVDKTTGD